MSKFQFINKLLNEPEHAVEKLNLVYTSDRELIIQRMKKGEEFIFVKGKQPLKDSKEMKRIESLVIPPAWEDVRVSVVSNGHLQAVGRDLKKRKQYRYHELWKKVRNQTKFYRMVQFGQKLPQFRKIVDEHLSNPNWDRNKIMALVVRLMEETHIRIGNEQYARRNKTYGLSTLRTKHVHLEKEKLRFEFVGKKGKQHSISLKNKRLVRLVSKCEELPGWELFQFYDKDGKKQKVDSSMVNDYIKEYTGEYFTAKDFRTWAASVIAFETLYDLPNTTDEDQIHKNILKAYDEAAKELGNTRNVCRKYYVHPIIAESYENGYLPKIFKATEKLKNKEYFTSNEQGVMLLIENYQPEFLSNINA